MYRCAVCERMTSTIHHMIFGNGNRTLCDKDKIVIPLCDECHTIGRQRLHDNPVSEYLSKVAGQAIWERRQCANGATEEQARQDFIKRYGMSYITVEGL